MHTSTQRNMKRRVKSKKALTITWICGSGTIGEPTKNASAEEQQQQPPCNLHHLTKFFLPKNPKGICSQPFLPSFNFSNNFRGLCSSHSQIKLASTNCQKNPKPQKFYLRYHSHSVSLYKLYKKYKYRR